MEHESHGHAPPTLASACRPNQHKDQPEAPHTHATLAQDSDWAGAFFPRIQARSRRQLPRSDALALTVACRLTRRRCVARRRALLPMLSAHALFRDVVSILPIISLLSLASGASAPLGTDTLNGRSLPPFQPAGAARTRSGGMRAGVQIHPPALIIAKHLGTLGPESVNASTVVLPGAVARVPFYVQPWILVSLDQQEAREGAFVAVEFENNPTCGKLEGSLFAPIVNGVARFTDLSISEHGRDYSLRFCFGTCRGRSSDIFGKDLVDAVTPQFAVRYGRLVLLQSVGNAAAGFAFETQPIMRVEREVDGEFVLAHDYR